MRLREHILVSTAAGAGIYAATGSLKMAAASFVAGVLVDVDHFLDYWLQCSFNLDLKKFFSTCEEYNLTKVRLVLHSAELLALIAVAAYLTRSAVLTGLCLGLCQHLAIDQAANRVHEKSYFLIYRLIKGFKAGDVFENT